MDYKDKETLKKINLSVDFFSMLEGVSRHEFLEKAAERALKEKEWDVLTMMAFCLANEEKES